MRTPKTAAGVNGFLQRVREWREADAWLARASAPASSSHGIDDGRRWVEVDGERFTEDDIVWLRRSGVITSVGTLEGRTAWQEWPQTCDRPEGPRPPDRIDEIRIRLKVTDQTDFYVYCMAASDGAAGPVGSCELRTFLEEQDPTRPNDANAVMRTTAEEDDDLLWLATLTVREHLPER